MNRAYRFLNISIFILLLLLSTNPIYSAPFKNIEISGYLSFEYENNIGGDRRGDLNGSFDMDLFDLVFNIQATERLRIAADLTWEHGSATEDGRGNVAVEYAFAEYTKADYLKIRAGKMFTHFGIYNEIHTAKPATLTVKEPLATNKNNGLGSSVRFYPRWLNGIALQGNYDMADMPLDYDVQLSNGDTEENNHNPFEEDDNPQKAFNFRVRLQVNDEIRTGFSFYNDSMEDNTSTDRLEIRSYGLQFEWEQDAGYGTELELVSGKENRKATVSIDRYAYTIMFFYHLNPTLIPYFRYEFLEPNKAIKNDDATLLILGVNYEVDTNMYLKSEIVQTNTKDNNTKYNGDDWTEFKASLSIGF